MDFHLSLIILKVSTNLTKQIYRRYLEDSRIYFSKIAVDFHTVAIILTCSVLAARSANHTVNSDYLYPVDGTFTRNTHDYFQCIPEQNLTA